MSGIAGVFYLDGRPADGALIERMTAAISHRGPDGIRHVVDGPVALGHCMFCTTPESLHETQPLWDETKQFCLTMDGRVDNRDELAHDLKSAGAILRDDTDAELVLKAYMVWGDDSPRRILGDFAYGIWDKLNRQLFCARDHMGVRPFYYHRGRNIFIFASEIGALISLDLISRTLNESRIVDYLVEPLDRDDVESTFYKEVRRLPAAHYLLACARGLGIHNFWAAEPPPSLKLSSMHDYGEAYREVFLRSVKCRLRSNRIVGSTLSGGLDSSSVVCATRDLLSGHYSAPLRTISLVQADPSECGETPYIAEVLRGGRLISYVLRSDQVAASSVETWQSAKNSDEPFETAHGFFDRLIISLAQKAGVGVLLDGIPGDLITPHSFYVASLVRSLRLRTALREVSYLSDDIRQPRWRSFSRYGLEPLTPKTFSSVRRLLRRGKISSSLLAKPFAQKMEVDERFAVQRGMLLKAARNVGKLHSWSFSSGLVPFAFERSTRYAAQSAIEPRHPFADRRLIDFFLSLPLTKKLSTPYTKMVMRTGMNTTLPALVCWRQRFAHPGSEFLHSSMQASLGIVKDALATNSHCLGEYVNMTVVNGLYAQHQASPSIESAWPLWTVSNLVGWFDGKSSQ